MMPSEDPPASRSSSSSPDSSIGVPSAATPAFKALVIIVLVLLQSERIRNLLFRKKSPGSPGATVAQGAGAVPSAGEAGSEPKGAVS